MMYAKKRSILLVSTLFIAIFFLSGIFVGDVDSTWAMGAKPELHSKHFFYGYPAGAPASNDTIIRDSYALSFNEETKVVDWVMYVVKRELLKGIDDQGPSSEHSWSVDPWLSEQEALELSDFNGTTGLGYDLATFVPLPVLAAEDEDTLLSLVALQKSNLAQGVWATLQKRIIDLSLVYNPLYVVSGPFYTESDTTLPQADEEHRVPDGFWMILCLAEGEINPGFIRAIAFRFDQDVPLDANPLDYITLVDVIEEDTGLDVLWELPDEIEEIIESQSNLDWAKEWF